MPRPIEKRPDINNYPPLRDWLHKLEARCMWQLPVGNRANPDAYLEMWYGAGLPRPVVVLVYADRMGWELFTPCDRAQVEATLADAEARMGQVVR